MEKVSSPDESFSTHFLPKYENNLDLSLLSNNSFKYESGKYKYLDKLDEEDKSNAFINIVNEVFNVDNNYIKKIKNEIIVHSNEIIPLEEEDENIKNTIFYQRETLKPETVINKKKFKKKKVFESKKVKKNNDFKGLVAILEESDNFNVNIDINEKKQIPNLFEINVGQNEITKEKTDPKTQIGVKRERSKTKIKEKKENGKSCEKKYNYFIKIARSFFNKFLLSNKLKKLIEKYGPNLYFEKFPQKFIHKAIIKKSKIFLEKTETTLEDILTKEEFYEEDEKEKYFKRNLRVLNKLKNNDEKNIFENSLLDDHLKMNCRDLYQEYLKSDEYIQKTKKLKDEEDTKFVNYARHFIEFFE